MEEDRVPDTPKRLQAMQNPLSPDSVCFDSVNDAYSDYETIATVPLNAHTPTQEALTVTQPLEHMTQPTQIIERKDVQTHSPTQQSSVVQVAGSSPLVPTSTTSRSTMPNSGLLPNSIAPNGTRFRPLAKTSAPIKRAPMVGTCDDDGPTYRGDSSDEEDNFASITDIKPSTFSKAPRSPEKERVLDSPTATNHATDKFKEITAAAFYNPLSANEPAKRQADCMGATNVVNAERAPKRARNEMSPPIKIDDYNVRVKVQRMRAVFSNKSTQACLDALILKRGNYKEALDYIARTEDKLSGTHLSDDELSLDNKNPQVRPAKQQIRATRRIQDKWASGPQQIPTQKEAPQTSSTTRRRLIRGPRSRQEPSAVENKTDNPPVPKRPGRLIRGRRARSRSPSESPGLLADESLSDSEASVISEEDSSLDGRVLNFFNTCKPEDLADIAEVSIDLANVLTSSRPFSTLDKVRAVTNDDKPSDKPAAKKRSYSKRPFGDKLVDKCLDMWKGYEAVDALVEQCESLGKPIAKEMEQWGVDVFGAKKGGELDLVNLNKSPVEQSHDSGIGTPYSRRSGSEDEGQVTDGSPNKKFLAQPEIMSDSITMKDYQVVGLNWLSLIYKQKLSCILADDMGLGKTCQVIAFLAHLLEGGVKGPHLIVVPSSTLENWLREFSIFCPKLKTMPYYAGQSARALIREEMEQNRDEINVVITTYTIAKAKVDAAFLRTMNFCVCVYDEGHMLKNSKSLLYEKLIRIPARFRLLLTGTPLQNNLQELASLLGFILPSVFKERKEDLEYIFSAKGKTVNDSQSILLSSQRIARAKCMLTPFVLRRKKHQVIDLPAKTTRVEYCEMIESQKEIYQNEIETAKQVIANRAAGKKIVGNKSANVLMKLRQAAIHPLFYRRCYDNATLSRISKACLKEEMWSLSDPDQIYTELCAYSDFEIHTLCTRNPNSLSKFALKNDEWMKSGKIDKLCELLKQFTENKDRILIFSQFTMVMDILEHVLETLHIQFFRLDGTTNVEDRQSILDAFHDQTEIPVFMLSTKAAGAGINLACANKVIIFDSSFNPQEDIQAENRAHRVGQTREVEVVRLVTKNTIEEQMHTLGQTKLELDQKVAGEEEGGLSGKKSEEAGIKVVEEMLISGLEKK